MHTHRPRQRPHASRHIPGTLWSLCTYEVMRNNSYCNTWKRIHRVIPQARGFEVQRKISQGSTRSIQEVNSGILEYTCVGPDTRDERPSTTRRKQEIHTRQPTPDQRPRRPRPHLWRFIAPHAMRHGHAVRSKIIQSYMAYTQRALRAARRALAEAVPAGRRVRAAPARQRQR